jgi:putative phosphoesterase
MTTRVGLISDSHGAVPVGVHAALRGVDRILHAGDVCDPAVLVELGQIAPVVAVRGNCDDDGPTTKLPRIANVKIGGVRFLVVHSQRDLTRENAKVLAGVQVVVSGHTHTAAIDRVHGVLHVNPGSTEGRGDAPPSVGIVTIADDGTVEAEIVDL